jgi:hypothetical protein
MHGRNETQAILDPTSLDDLLHFVGDVTISRRFFVSKTRYSV